jgi:tryptophan-rich sensory protein
MPKTESFGILKLIASILICQLAGVVGSIFTMPAIKTWYESLNRPAWRPPNALFGPVWITLYLLIGIALFLVWRKGLAASGVKTALMVFFVQLVLNVLWSMLFFGLRSPGLGLAEIVFLWVAIVLNVVYFYQLVPISGLLLVPYLAWVSFAVILNHAIWQLNR